MTSAESAPPIVLIHGLWLSPRSWEGWKERFESRGYRVLAPAWPRMQQDVEEVRRDPSAMNGLGVAEIADHYGDIVRDLDQPPIIMGHSFGGLITELLLDRGLGACGVALSPAPVKGVLRLPPAQLRSAFPVLGTPFNRGRTVELSPRQGFVVPRGIMHRTRAPDRPTPSRRHVPRVPPPAKARPQSAS